MTAPDAVPQAAPVTVLCPECGASMALRRGRYGLFYGCVEFRATGCSGVHGAHADGTPLGKPGDAATRLARIRAHRALDSLWKLGGKLSRAGAYRWMQRALGLSKREAHIGRMTREQCDALIAAVDDFEDTPRGASTTA